MSMQRHAIVWAAKSAAQPKAAARQRETMAALAMAARGSGWQNAIAQELISNGVSVMRKCLTSNESWLIVTMKILS